MGIYLTPEFEAERQDARISDTTLCKAAKAIFSGLSGDHLGKYTYKKRLALPAVSPRDGARAIVFFNDGTNIYFFDMYLKSKLSKKKGKELEDDEIDAYCKIAEDFVALSQVDIQYLLKSKELLEVTCDD
ncbi:type II toxin-antitoxin system RelE/ParE family toxin [Phytobacter sp. V91]|uniref:type II toxin-antitoxin system RelE/ParE family toxin n=1 Tax=Phytobacter sp. V91 TaxID=3369425 RepID=UPI003F5DCF40